MNHHSSMKVVMNTENLPNHKRKLDRKLKEFFTRPIFLEQLILKRWETSCKSMVVRKKLGLWRRRQTLSKIWKVFKTTILRLVSCSWEFQSLCLYWSGCLQYSPFFTLGAALVAVEIGLYAACTTSNFSILWFSSTPILETSRRGRRTTRLVQSTCILWFYFITSAYTST